jgi:hypothetical protein
MSNEELRNRFRPDRITTLFVGESAPAGGTFFYNNNSSLFRAMKKAFGGGTAFLDDFKRNGFYLDDLVQTPINKLASKERSARRWGSVSEFTNRLQEYKPEAVVIVMRAIRPMVLKAMPMAGLSYEPYCTPHPAFGNSGRFHMEMTQLIARLPVVSTSEGIQS